MGECVVGWPGVDGGDGARVLHPAVGGVPVLEQGAQRGVCLPQPPLGAPRV